MVGTPHSQPALSPSSGTFVRAVTRPAAAESASVSLDLMFGPQDQGGLEGAVVAAVDRVCVRACVRVCVSSFRKHNYGNVT